MFNWIKKKIKLAKIWAIIFAVIFLGLIFSNIYLLVEVSHLKELIK
jgi:hypothetical protein